MRILSISIPTKSPSAVPAAAPIWRCWPPCRSRRTCRRSTGWTVIRRRSSFSVPWSTRPPRGPAADRFPDAKTAKRLSPTSLIRRKLPPMIFFHGKSDRITPFEEVEKFRRRMRWRGNSCTLVDFERADHSFFNFNVSHKNFERTIRAADQFLVDHGQLAPRKTRISSELCGSRANGFLCRLEEAAGIIPAWHGKCPDDHSATRPGRCRRSRSF